MKMEEGMKGLLLMDTNMEKASFFLRMEPITKVSLSKIK